MRKFVLTAVAMTAFAALSAPAFADMHPGPTRDGNKCFTASPGMGKDGKGGMPKEGKPGAGKYPGYDVCRPDRSKPCRSG